MAIQANGKIVAVGEDGNGEFALARYNPNGSLDASFSGDGRQTTDFTLYTADEANAVVLQADGKIVAVGGSRAEEFGDFALARYNPNGSLDPSFSGDGMQTPNLGFPDFANGAAIQPDGKTVAVGLAGGELDSQDFALARLNVDGSLDASFSGDGEQRTDFGGTEFANGVAIQSDGKIVAVGRVDGATGRDFALARYNANGSLDASFSGDGKRSTNFEGFDDASAVAIQADGKIVAVGRTFGTNGTAEFALARYFSE